MAFLEVQRRCQDCEETRRLVREMRAEVNDYRREVRESLLDYESLYDKVRTNLAKLGSRKKAAEKVEDENGQPHGPYEALWAYRNQNKG